MLEIDVWNLSDIEEVVNEIAAIFEISENRALSYLCYVLTGGNVRDMIIDEIRGIISGET